MSAVEDTATQGQVLAKDPEGKALTFSLAQPATKGTVDIDPVTGAFTYSPGNDLNGSDSFTFAAADQKGALSAPAIVTIEISPVNDAPVLDAIASQKNSAETLDSRIIVPARDVDGDTLTVAANSSDTAVATVATDVATGEVVITPMGYGSTSVAVSVSDGIESVSTAFDFAVTDVTRRYSLAAASSKTTAVVLQNASDRMAVFVLEHNQFPIFESTAKVIDYVKALPDEITDEAFERKLWRFLRDSTVHYYPLMPLQFKQAPLATLNSLGFGFCGDMSTSFVMIARDAGYESRVWSLGSHVAPEIKVNGRWQLYDPDLGVYYRNRAGEVAGVEELAADPTLVSNPTNPIYPPGSWPYSAVLEDIYATTANNFVADGTLLPTTNAAAGKLELPPGARLTYPGRWTEPPVAYVAFGERIFYESELPNWRTIAQGYDGAASFTIPFHRQAKLDIPDGWTGDLPMPLWVWDIQGSGSVRIDGVDYTIGSAELVERLRYRLAARSITVFDARNLSLIMEINLVRFDIKPENSINLTGRDVWALEARLEDIGSNGAGEKWNDVRAKPTGF